MRTYRSGLARAKALASLASMQTAAQTRILIPAGTPEDQALQAISNESDAQKKIGMLEEFVQKFAGNNVAVAYGNWQLSQQYAGSDPAKALAYGDKALAAMPEVVDILGSIAAKRLTPQDVGKLKGRLLATPARGRKNPKDPEKERPRTPASVNRYLQDLRAAYNVARRNGKVDKNPVADVKLLRENNKRVREMTSET